MGDDNLPILRLVLLGGICFAVLWSLLLWQMTTAIAIEDVRREVSILRALTGHKNLVQFYDAFEDDENVYIAME